MRLDRANAVWLYLRFTLSYRDVEDLLAERGLMISNESIRRWVLKFGPIIARNLRETRGRAASQACQLLTQAPLSRHPRGGSRWPRTIRIRQDATVTTAEPAIAVARDQVIERVADHPWDEVEDPCPPPARKLAGNAQHGFGFHITLTVRDEGKGIRTIRIDPELVGERTSFGQLNRNETKIAATITFAHEIAAARAKDTYAVEQDQAVRRIAAAGTFLIYDD
jgi:hypothetical protein